MSKSYIWTQNTPISPHLSLSASSVASCQSGGSCFPLSVYRRPLSTRFTVSCRLAPAPASLLIPSYLPAVQWCHQGNTLARVKEQENRRGCCVAQSQNCRDQRPGSSVGNFREINTSEAISPGSGLEQVHGNTGHSYYHCHPLQGVMGPMPPTSLHHLANKGPSSQSYGSSRSHVRM